jgi:hypothetical protein
MIRRMLDESGVHLDDFPVRIALSGVEDADPFIRVR